MSKQLFWRINLAILSLSLLLSGAYLLLNLDKPAEAALPNYKIRPVIFKPSDQTLDSTYQTSVNSGIDEIRVWYKKQSKGVLKRDNTSVYSSANNLNFFKCASSTDAGCVDVGSYAISWSKVTSELVSNGYTFSSGNIIMVYMLGGGNVALAYNNGVDATLASEPGGWALLGENALRDLAGYNGTSNRNITLGTSAHELGHALGLPHPDTWTPEWQTLMGAGWFIYPEVILSNTPARPDTQIVSQSPLLETESAPCVRPTVKITITQNTTLCPGIYNIADSTNTGSIVIGADNITLDGSNATLIGTGQNGFGVFGTGRSNITIKNLKIKNFYFGIKIVNSSIINVQNIDSSTNRKDTTTGFVNLGLGGGYGGGIFFDGVTDSLITRSIFRNQSSGIELKSSLGNTISYNHASYNTVFGIHLVRSSNNQVLFNQAHHNIRFVSPSCPEGGCDSAGIMLSDGSDLNTIRGNEMSFSGDGFFLGNGNQTRRDNNFNIITENTANYSPHNGFESTFSGGNKFLNNVADNNDYGFWLGFSYENEVKNNKIRNNKNGIAWETGRDSNISFNTLTGNKNAAISLWMSLNSTRVSQDPDWGSSHDYAIVENVIKNNGDGLTVRGVTNVTVTGNDFVGNLNRAVYSEDDPNTAIARISGLLVNQNNLYCEDPTPKPYTNLAIGKAVASFNKRTDGGPAANINDGDRVTVGDVWSVRDLGDWARIDLGSSQAINSVVIYPSAQNAFDIPNSFFIEVSSTGSFSGEQTVVVTEPDWGNTKYKVYKFNPVTTRYVRFYAAQDHGFGAVQEMEIYNYINIDTEYRNFCFRLIENKNSSTSPTKDINATNNYWSPTPLANIDTAILDINDQSTRGRVNYTPTITTPVDQTGIDTNSPTVSINLPASGQTIGGLFNITVSVSDNDAVSRVEYYLVGGGFLGHGYPASFTLPFETKTIPNGSHTLVAKVFDKSGNSSTNSRIFSVNNPAITMDDNAPTSVSLTFPTSGATVSGTRDLTATASDNVGVTKIDFFIDNNFVGSDATSPFAFSWNSSGTADGSHSAFAKAFDADGNNTSSPTINFTVNNTTCSRSNPTVTVLPSSITANRGSTVNYTVSVKNNDNNACTASPFTLSNTLPSGWSAVFEPNSLAIGPGITLTSTWRVTSASGAAANTYTITARAINGNATSFTSSANAQYVVTVIQKPGDVDDDGDVDIFDLSALITLWKTTNSSADFNNNGVVDIYDLSILLTNWTG